MPISDRVPIECKCIVCGYKKTLIVNADALDSWKSGTLIQNAFPQMSLDDRELMISQICGKCFDRMFKKG